MFVVQYDFAYWGFAVESDPLELVPELEPELPELPMLPELPELESLLPEDELFL